MGRRLAQVEGVWEVWEEEGDASEGRAGEEEVEVKKGEEMLLM